MGALPPPEQAGQTSQLLNGLPPIFKALLYIKVSHLTIPKTVDNYTTRAC